MGEAEVFFRATSALAMRKDVNVTYIELDEFDNAGRLPTHSASEHALEAWPTQPRPLVIAQKERVFWTIFDIALIALPVCLMVKTGLCFVAYGLDRDAQGPYIDEASLLSQGLVKVNEQLVTLFTIVFVTIMSTFVKRYALWKAQHGACISDLEQFQGSISLPSTLKLIWSLRSFGLSSLVLTVAWSFYYLGSQAVKLEYQLSLSEDYGPLNIISQRPDAPSLFDPDFQELSTQLQIQTESMPAGTPNAQSRLTSLNIKFGAMILEDQESRITTINEIPTNPGTNQGPIIPEYISVQMQLQQSLSDLALPKSEGWLDVVKKSAHGYTSLAGQSLWVDYNSSGYRQAITSPILGTYTLQNISYFNVNCSTPNVHLISDFPSGTLPNSAVSFNMTSVLPDAPRDRNGYRLRQFDYWHKGFALDLLPGMKPTETVSPINNSFQLTLRAFQTSCNLTTSYVDMQVGCISTGCYANKLRWAHNTDAAGATGYGTPFDDAKFAGNFLNNFVLSTGNPQGIHSTTIVEEEFFPDESINMTYWSELGPANYAREEDIYNDQFISQDLTLGFNTYYMLSQSVISTINLPNITLLLSSPNQTDALFQVVKANGAMLNQAYRIYWRWVPVDIMACSILLAAAIKAHWLRINTLAPDIFGYVSSLTRDNPHIHLPTEGSALSGVDRARMLKGMRVKIADVQSGNHQDDSIGRVGLVLLDAEVRPLHSTTRYV